MTPCTQWYRHDRVHGWQFNHLENGHSKQDKPTPRFPTQEGWKNAQWIRYSCWLTSDVPPRVSLSGIAYPEW